MTTQLKLASGIAALIVSFQSAAQSAGDFFLSPSVAVGSNSVQGTNVRFGLDLGMHSNEYLYGGVGGFYGVGERPDNDREIGAGPFVGLGYPVLGFLTLQLREDIDYIDERTPVWVAGTTYTHTSAYGIISATYAGVHITFTRNFGFAVGYRLVAGLSKTSLGDGRSGVALGFTIGF